MLELLIERSEGLSEVNRSIEFLQVCFLYPFYLAVEMQSTCAVRSLLDPPLHQGFTHSIGSKFDATVGLHALDRVKDIPYIIEGICIRAAWIETRNLVTTTVINRRVMVLARRDLDRIELDPIPGMRRSYCFTPHLRGMRRSGAT